MDIGNVKDMIEELEITALDFEDTRYGLLITASEMMMKLEQENERLLGELIAIKKENEIIKEGEEENLKEVERLRSENETLVNNIVKIGDIAQEQDTYVERLREALEDIMDRNRDIDDITFRKGKKALEEK